MFWTIQSYTCERVSLFSGLDKIAWIGKISWRREKLLLDFCWGLYLPEWLDPHRKGCPRRFFVTSSSWRRCWVPGGPPSSSSQGWSHAPRAAWAGRHGRGSHLARGRGRWDSDHPRADPHKTPAARDQARTRSRGRSWLSARPQTPLASEATACAGAGGCGGRAASCPRAWCHWAPASRASCPHPPPPWDSPAFREGGC